jgi:hypothetical protein
MAAMATPQPALSSGPTTMRALPGRTVVPWWIAVSVIGAALGALAAWQIRSLVQPPSPAALGQDLAYFATLVSVAIGSGAQWLLFRRWRWEAFWWIPGTVGASLVAAAFVVPTVLNALVGPSGLSSMAGSVLVGAIALGASGLLIGAAQAFILRGSAGDIAWLWVPATALGGALAGAMTTALASRLLVLPAFAVVSLVAAASALLTAGCQSPVLVRLLR